MLNIFKLTSVPVQCPVIDLILQINITLY